MLVLSRRPNEDIKIGRDIVIRIIRVKGKQVSIGIHAPRGVNIARAELIQQPQRGK